MILRLADRSERGVSYCVDGDEIGDVLEELKEKGLMTYYRGTWKITEAGEEWRENNDPTEYCPFCGEWVSCSGGRWV